MIVADANLVAALVLPTADTPQAVLADAIRDRDEAWAAPALWRSEFRNLLATLMRAGRVSLSQAEAFAEVAVLATTTMAAPDAAILPLAHASRCTAYDCEYVALARALGVPLVTFDRALQRAFPDIAVDPAVFLAA